MDDKLYKAFITNLGFRIFSINENPEVFFANGLGIGEGIAFKISDLIEANKEI